MKNEMIGLAASFLYVGGVLGLATLLHRAGVLRGEGARKFVHILASNWALIAIWFFKDIRFALIPPACFLALNAASRRWRIFRAIERENDDSMGTVYYAGATLGATAFAYYVNQPFIAACGVLAMGYGDGLAALVGRAFGKRRLPAPLSAKTVMGTAAVFAASFVCVFLVLRRYLDADAAVIALGGAFTCAGGAALFELIDANGLDNLTVPLGVTVLSYFYLQYPVPCIILVSTALVAFSAWAAGQLSARASELAFFLAVGLFAFGGIWAYAALLSFFWFAAFAGRLCRNERREEAGRAHVRHGQRGAVQVIANGLPPALFALLYFLTGAKPFEAAVFGAVAAACADTLAGEFGMAFGKDPFSIMTLRAAQPGISGGVTAAGLLAGVAGAAIIAPYAGALGGFAVAGAVIGGSLGAMCDSALGGALQVKYASEGGGLTEIKNGKPVSGLPWLNNDWVNFFAIIVGGLITLGVYALFI